MLALALADIAREGQDEYDAFFLHFNRVDYVGHRKGAGSPDIWSPEYLATARRSEGYVGQIWAQIKQRSSYLKEDWLVIVCSDHGKKVGGGHGGDSFNETNALLMMLGDNMRTGPPAPQSADVAATVLCHHVHIAAAWGLDGACRKAISTSASASTTTTTATTNAAATTTTTTITTTTTVTDADDACASMCEQSHRFKRGKRTNPKKVP